MLPFLCEITLCFIVSYHVALLFLSRERRETRGAGDAEATSRRRQSGR